MSRENYSVWFNLILQNKDIKAEQHHKEEMERLNQERLRLQRENELREERLRSVEADRREIRAKRSLLRQQEGIERLERNINQTELSKAEKAKLKDDKKLAKLRAKKIAEEQKEYSKTYEDRVKTDVDNYEDTVRTIDSSNKAMTKNFIGILRAQRKEEKKNVRILDAKERTRSRQLNEELRAQEKIRAKELEIQEAEYKRREKLRKEQAEMARKAEALRRKRTGETFWWRLEKKLRRLAKIYSFRNLRDTVNTYGYSYSFNEFAKQSLAIVLVVTVIAWVSQIRGTYLIFLIVASMLSVPWLLYSWFNQMFNNKKFEMVQSYLSNILPIFMQKPKIRYSLGEVRDMANGQMQAAIDHAIDYIDTSSEDEDMMKTALSFIETEFPNSRICSVHKLLLDIEEGNSEDYTPICENMYTDVEAWIRRVYGFQKDLKSRRTSLVILCLFSLLMNCMFTYMYGTSEIFNGFTERGLYQACTSIFIFLVLLVAALIMTQLHGSWLINDSSEKEEQENTDAYMYIHSHRPKTKKQDVICAVFLVMTGIILMVGYQNKAAAVLFPFALIFAMRTKLTWNSKQSRVKKALMLEFPVWLRGVALNLHDMTVINAISASKETCSYSMAQEIDKFFKIYDENPTSIRAFNEFLAEYQIEDVQATMKILFTVQSMSEKEIQNQTVMLINRNQELLTKTETIRNKDSLGYAEMLGYAPMLLLTMQLLVSMVLMFMHIMEYMNDIMAEGI